MKSFPQHNCSVGKVDVWDIIAIIASLFLTQRSCNIYVLQYTIQHKTEENKIKQKGTAVEKAPVQKKPS